MNLDEVLNIATSIMNIATSIILAVGTSGAIILGLSNWLGKIWAERILNSDRTKHQKTIESFKSKLSSEVEILKSDLSSDVERLKTELSLDVERLRIDLALKLEVSKRLSENQFHLYNDLWSSLYDLKIAGDRLWERVDRGSVKNLARQLTKTESQIFRSSLLIENDHYERLKKLMEQFNEFKFGKNRLVELKNIQSSGNQLSNESEDGGSLDRSSINLRPQDIEEVVWNNRDVKDRYSDLINEIEVFFRNQIRGIN
jgi:hypothetical protein